MTDYFALLHQSRRPWLDGEELETKYHELARLAHPDASAVNDNANPDRTTFSDVGSAYRTLRDPKLRLQHLLTLECQPPVTASTQIPADLVHLFMEIVPALKSRNQNAITALIQRVEHAFAEATKELRGLDARWTNDPSVHREAESLYHRFSFLGRWRDILNEAALAL